MTDNIFFLQMVLFFLQGNIKHLLPVIHYDILKKGIAYLRRESSLLDCFQDNTTNVLEIFVMQ